MGSISARTVTNSLKDNFYPTMAKEGCFGGNKSVRESVGNLLLSAQNISHPCDQIS